MYVTLCMPTFPVWVFWVRFCGLYCPNVIVVLACGGTWRCQQRLFCVEVVKRHLKFLFIHSFNYCSFDQCTPTHPLIISYIHMIIIFITLLLLLLHTQTHTWTITHLPFFMWRTDCPPGTQWVAKRYLRGCKRQSDYVCRLKDGATPCSTLVQLCTLSSFLVLKPDWVSTVPRKRIRSICQIRVLCPCE